jgi:LysM repeat protein
MRRIILTFSLVLILVLISLSPVGKVQASGSVSGADMIAMMNSWRSSYWSNALIEDASLDSCAQSTAEEMARIGAWDHLANIGYAAASERCVDHGFGGGKAVRVTENWAADYNMTIDKLASYWSDAAHMLPATMQQYAYVGVGIAEASNGTTYYILQAGAITGEDLPSGSDTSSETTSSSATEDLSEYKNPVLTSTPNEDGSIYHVVLSGQFLFDLATYYGVTVDQIKTLNNLTSDSIYAGDVLLIRLAPTVTITPTRTITVQMPTRTITQTPPPATTRPMATMTPTPEGAAANGLPKIDRQWVGLGILVLSAVGFFVVFYFFFLKKPKPKE